METRYKKLPDWLYFFLVMPSLALLPRGLGYRLARHQGRHLARANGAHFGAVCDALKTVLPYLNAAEVARQTFENLAFEDLDTFYFPFWNKNNIGRYFSFSGLEYLDSALEKGKGVLVFTAHFGSICAPLVAFALKGYQFFHLARNSPEDADFTSAYRKYAKLKTNWMARTMGHPLLFIQARQGKYESKSSTSVMLEAYRLLRRGQIVSMAFDVPPQLVQGPLTVDFLGKACRFPSGLINLAYHSEAPILSYFAFRDKARPFHQQVIVEPPLSLTGELSRDLQQVVDRFSRHLAASPEQWFAWDSLDAFLTPDLHTSGPSPN
ncbi:MAG TPA: hypothetical protein PLP42_14600 [Acidobacteriota bacterium]|nr:hypothetical protein [Acidobacteriota bacterium]